MIYNTNGNKQTRKYGRKNRRNMRGGDGESSAVIIKILLFNLYIHSKFICFYLQIVSIIHELL
jgi:hypothetical protein